MMDKLKNTGYKVIVALSLCVISAVATIYLMNSKLSAVVPDVRGLSSPEARAELKRMGLEMTVQSEEYDAGVQLGAVIKQDTAPGSAVKGDGGVVRVIISRGQNTQRMPSVVGLRLEQARALFKQRSIAIGREVMVHSDTIPEGQVLAQLPPPQQGGGGTITVVASLGPADVTYYCPDFIGIPKDEALALASALGLEVALKEASMGSGSKVTTQSPLAGADIRKGETIYLGVENGR